MLGQVMLLEQRHGEAAAGGVTGDASTIDAAANDDQVKDSCL